MNAYLIVLACSAIPAYLLTPAVRRMSMRVGAVDIPDDRKVHERPTPTLGGIAIFVGVVVGLFVASELGSFKASMHPLASWPPVETVAILLGAALIFVLGLIDDVKTISAPTKLAGQVLAAGFVYLVGGVRLEWFRLPPFGTLSLGASDSAVATIGWIVLIVNAINLIDGLDGLAAGIAAIAAGTFFLYSFELNKGLALQEITQTAPLISVVVLGAALGFLPHNFNPAKIFMGDSGSMTLGFLLAAATVVGVGRSTPTNFRAESVIFYLPVVIPFIILAIPILDTALAVLRRARRGQDIFHADKRHLHHQLLEIGHGHRQAVLIMYAWTAVIAGAGLALSFTRPIFTLPFAVAAVAIFLYTLLPRIARRGVG